MPDPLLFPKKSAETSAVASVLWVRLTHFQAMRGEEIKHQHEMKACSLQICSGGKREAEPLEKHLFIFKALSQAPCNTPASALSLEGTLLPCGGSQTGPPGRIHQALLKNCVKKESAGAARDLPNILTFISLFPLCYSHYQSGSSLDTLVPQEN